MESWAIILNKLGNFQIKRGLYSFVNPYSMLKMRSKEDLANGIDFWLVDGISLVNEVNSSYGKKIKRFSFDNTSLAPIVFRYALENKLSIAIIGTKAEFIDDAISNIQANFDVNIQYYRNGFFKDNLERKACIDYIVSQNFDLVIVGMGTPYQESFLLDLKNEGWNGYGFTCGGYLHQIAKKEQYYPKFFDKYNIRWIYRIIDEPKLLKRYTVDYANFFLLFRRFKRKHSQDLGSNQNPFKRS